MRSATAESEKKIKPNCKDKVMGTSARRESVAMLLVMHRRKVSRTVLR